MTKWNNHSAIKQIEICGYECEGGPLRHNTAWQWLMNMESGPKYRMGDRVPYVLHAEVQGFALTREVELTIVGIRMSSGTDGRLWEYDLSADPPDAYHYGGGVTAKASQREIDNIMEVTQ